MVGNHISVVQQCGLHLKRACFFAHITLHSKEKPVGDTFHDEPVLQLYLTFIIPHPCDLRRQLLAAGAGTASFDTDMADR